MGINIKLSIEINDVQDKHLLEALDRLLKSASQVTYGDDVEQKQRLDRRRRQPPKPRFPSLKGDAKWRAFHDALPKRAKDFILLIEEHFPDPLLQSEAMQRLELTSPKAMGGVTGSIKRWAEVDHIELPWRAESVEGERAWVWTGVGHQGPQEL